jgi:perosamine synthetase
MIPVFTPNLDAGAKVNVDVCMEKGWISSQGDFVRQFEEEWAAYCGVKHGIAVNSGTSALEIAMAALELDEGSEVILPSYTIISCASAILNAGCRIKLVDVDPDTWCLDVAQTADAIGPKTRAIMPVHMFGHPVDMPAVMDLADSHGLAVIEDAAEAHGAMAGRKVVGGIGDIGCFSFYANKIITTGEGGMAVTNNDSLAERLRSYRDLCFNEERRFLHYRMGHSYRMTNLQAAVGVSQIDRVPEIIVRKRALADQYKERLSDIDSLNLPTEKGDVQNVYWMFGVVLAADHPLDATKLAHRLKDKGIETRPFFLGMHQQPVLKNLGLFDEDSYPVTEHLARNGLYLPSSINLGTDQLDTVCEALKDCLAGR